MQYFHLKTAQYHPTPNSFWLDMWKLHLLWRNVNTRKTESPINFMLLGCISCCSLFSRVFYCFGFVIETVYGHLIYWHICWAACLSMPPCPLSFSPPPLTPSPPLSFSSEFRVNCSIYWFCPLLCYVLHVGHEVGLNPVILTCLCTIPCYNFLFFHVQFVITVCCWCI